MKNVLFIDIDLLVDAKSELIFSLINQIYSNIPFMHFALMHRSDRYSVAYAISNKLASLKIPASLVYSEISEVKAFLDEMKKDGHGLGTFAFILSDFASPYASCKDKSLRKIFAEEYPNNIVRCEIEKNELTEKKMKEAEWIMTNFGRDKQNSSKKTFFCSDTHFRHSNIIKYCNRPFADVDEMDAELIKRWNNAVSKDDIVWHLGDFAFGSKQHTIDIVPKLNGNINLVMGNHDLRNSQSFYLDAGFKHVYDRPVIWHNFFILSHEPLQWVSNDGVYANIFGHVHNSKIYRTFTARSACVCVERFNYAPVLWDTIQDEMKKYENGECNEQ